MLLVDSKKECRGRVCARPKTCTGVSVGSRGPGAAKLCPETAASDPRSRPDQFSPHGTGEVKQNLFSDMIPFAAVPKMLPTRRRGRRVHISRVYAWHLQGLHGVRLRALSIGGTLHTSRTWLTEFFENVTAAKSAIAPEVTMGRGKALATARATLDAAGI